MIAIFHQEEFRRQGSEHLQPRMPRQIVSILGGVVQDVCTITDRIPDDGETVVASAFSMAPGGKGSNSAVAVHRLTRANPKNRPPAAAAAHGEVQEEPLTNSNPDQGLDDDDDDIEAPSVRMVGAVGADQFGPSLKRNLERCGVNVDGVRVVEGQQTAVANILLESYTKANRIMQYPGVNHNFQPSDFTTAESLGGGVRPDLMICQLELDREAIEQAIETAGREGIDVLLNPSPAFFLMPKVYPKITHLVVNETEAFLLSEIERDDIKNQTAWTKVADSFLALRVKNVVVTLGADGANYANESSRGHVDAEKNVLIRDTSGAG